jgi:hypothetical protein
VPALQSVHSSLPVTFLYFPAVQAEHVPPFGPVNPRLQTQLLNAVEPLTDCELLGQALQVLLAEAPTVVEYVLTPQFKQVLAVVAPVVVEYLPAPQFTQELAAVAPVVVRYLPASQVMQAEEPVVRAQRQTTSQLHMHMHRCIDVCVCVPISMYVCAYVTYVCMQACMYTHTQ